MLDFPKKQTLRSDAYAQRRASDPPLRFIGCDKAETAGVY